MTDRLSLLPLLLAAVFFVSLKHEKSWHFHSRHKDREMPSCLMISSFLIPPPRHDVLGLLIYDISTSNKEEWGRHCGCWKGNSRARNFSKKLLIEWKKYLQIFALENFRKWFSIFARVLPKQIKFQRNIYFEPDLLHSKESDTELGGSFPSKTASSFFNLSPPPLSLSLSLVCYCLNPQKLSENFFEKSTDINSTQETPGAICKGFFMFFELSPQSLIVINGMCFTWNAIEESHLTVWGFSCVVGLINEQIVAFIFEFLLVLN